jgi:hypothetical protein
MPVCLQSGTFLQFFLHRTGVRASTRRSAGALLYQRFGQRRMRKGGRSEERVLNNFPQLFAG